MALRALGKRMRSRHRRRLPPVRPEEAVPPPIGVRDELVRPLFSVMIPTYNCSRLLRKTLTSVLEQDPGPDVMQIEVVDDASRDDPESVVQELGKGRVAFFRQSRNLGVVGNFNTCISRSRGELVHILHGDDVVYPGFYDEVRRLVGAFPDAGLYATRVMYIDEDGVAVGLSPRVRGAEERVSTDPAFLRETNPLQFAGCVVRRSSFESSGGFLPFLVHTNDWEMWYRVTAEHGIVTSSEVLAGYRQFAGSDTTKLTWSAENFLDFDRWVAVASMRGYPGSFDATLKVARSSARRNSDKFRRVGERDAARANSRYWIERAKVSEILRWSLMTSIRRLLAIGHALRRRLAQMAGRDEWLSSTA